MEVLIVEDELLIAAELRSRIRGFGMGHCIIATSYTEAVNILQTRSIHLALLDIRLGGYKSGMDVARYIRETGPLIPFIYLTSHTDRMTMEQALKTGPNAYLEKPFREPSLYAALQLALSSFRADNKESELGDDGLIIRDAFFVCQRNGNYIRIDTGNIAVIRNAGNYLELYEHTGEKHLIRTTQKKILPQLPGDFVKIHKSYVINTAHVKAIEGDLLQIAGQQIPLAATYRALLQQKLSIR